nr:diguanylate cyclase [Herminiimonas fonticola]
MDHFKGYNDTYGHLAGDACLRKIAATIRSMESRQGDLAARYGGEEIVVMLPNCDRKNAIAIAETILQKIRLLAISHAANPIGIVTVSAGVGVLQSVDQSDSPNKIIAKADKALYIAKSDGRNCVAAC